MKTEVNDKKFLKAVEVANALKVSEQKAYSIIRTLNMELEQQGYSVIKGRVLKEYFEEKYAIKKKEVKESEMVV